MADASLQSLPGAAGADFPDHRGVISASAPRGRELITGDRRVGLAVAADGPSQLQREPQTPALDERRPPEERLEQPHVGDADTAPDGEPAESDGHRQPDGTERCTDARP